MNIKDEDRNFARILVSLCFIFILVVCGVIVLYDEYFPIDDNDNGSESMYATIYKNVSVCEAKDLITSSQNLTIIYCQGGCKPCSWKNLKIDSSAFWATGTKSYWNSTNDFLIYDKFGGNKSVDYCERLLGHVYGNVYRLNGGYESWKKGC